MSPAMISTRASFAATSRAVSAIRPSTRQTTRISGWSSSSRRTRRRPMKPGNPVTSAAATGSAGPLEDDHGDLAVGALLIVVVGGPDLGHELPQPLALLALRDAVAGLEAVAAD